MAVKDITLTSLDGDLNIKNGDFFIDFSDNQHIHDIINDGPGEWKQFPLVGVNLKTYQYAPTNANQIQQNIKYQLTADGYQSSPIVEFSYQLSKLTINPRAIRL